VSDEVHPVSLKLYFHPFSSYCQKALIALYENAIPFEPLLFDALRPDGSRDAYGVAQAREMLDTAYAWLDTAMARREWAAGGDFSLADCAAAPSLFYSDWTHAIGDRHPHVADYRRRLLQRPSFARAVDEARPYRGFFPLGAPERD
jgi:glutathione S-transferase